MRGAITRILLFAALVILMAIAGFMAIYHKRLDPHQPWPYVPPASAE